MEIPMSEVIDRLTVLRLKVENGSENARAELRLHEKAIEEFEKKQGKGVDEELIRKLQDINKELWDLVSELNEEKNSGASLKKLGEIYIKQHIANKKRIQIKNKIAEETLSGFRDVKVNSDLK